MHWFLKLVLLIYLLLLSVYDLKEKRLPVWLLLVGGAFLVGCLGFTQGLSVEAFLLTGMSALFLFGIAALTREAIGYGDCVVLSICSLCFSVFDFLWMVWISSVGLLFFYIGRNLIQKEKACIAYPYLPFLTGAVGISLLWI
jgi:prepilin signal peptidase PulO-like enzyme (type II secretory pathway)